MSKAARMSYRPDKIRKSKIFAIFEKIHPSFLNNLKSEETKSQIKPHLSYFDSSYYYNYKSSPRILRQHCVLRNHRKNKDIFITKPDEGNGVVILDRKLYNNFLNLKSSVKTQPWNAKLHDNVFYLNWSKKTFLMKLNMISQNL